jgi:hypothetical protein
VVKVVERPPEPGDVDALLADMRQADRDEVAAMFGAEHIREAIETGIARSTPACWTLTIDGQVLCVGGVAPVSLLGGEGAPWMLATRLFERNRGALIRVAPSYIARMLAAFPHLLNVVDARNTKAIAWLRRVGFTILDPIIVGAEGRPFHPFLMDA